VGIRYKAVGIVVGRKWEFQYKAKESKKNPSGKSGNEFFNIYCWGKDF